MAIRPQLIGEYSFSLGERCALCKERFLVGDEVIICPADGTPHHVHCWQANDNACSAYGCTGSGQPILRTPVVEEATVESDEPAIEGEVITPPAAEEANPDRPGRRSKVRTYPASSFSCTQTCLIIAIAISIIFFAVGCFGLWAMLDFLFMEILGWHYREPLTALFEAGLLLL